MNPYITINQRLTVPEYAALIRREKETVRRMIRDGRLKAEKVGAIWLIDPDEKPEYRRNVNSNDKRLVSDR